ncbi:MAG TPA: hypothetical protein VG817_00710, partial [Gemmatimonadales bacterium]|nr:hypothetical protein [Gemmatimonadales bacterium]
SLSLPLPRWARMLTLVLGIAACAVPLSLYDGTTYQTLTDLKVDATLLVGSFDSVAVKENAPAISGTRVRFLKALEYEKGKGKENHDTADQLELLLTLYDQVVADYRASGPNPRLRDYRERAVQLGQAFDTAIATEAAKNREK